MTSGIDREKIEELRQFDLDNDDTLLNELFEIFRQSGPERLSRMKSAIATHSWKDLERLAHTLKSSSGNLGIHGIQNLCQNLEDSAAEGNILILNPLIEEIQLQMGAAMLELQSLIGEMNE